MEYCEDKYGSIRKSDVEKVVSDINDFCKQLRANKVKNAKEVFANLPKTVQCMFLDYAQIILYYPSHYNDISYKTAFYVFKMFTDKTLKEQEIFGKYTKPTMKRVYEKARDWERDERGLVKKEKKDYEKKYQKYEEPDKTTDAMYIFYTSLYDENPSSKLSIIWLTEHGVFEDDERDALEQKYRSVAGARKLK